MRGVEGREEGREEGGMTGERKEGWRKGREGHRENIIFESEVDQVFKLTHVTYTVFL